VAQRHLWRVRVKRSIESWVEVQAETVEDALAEAGKVPGVIGVLGLVIRADFQEVPKPPPGVREEDDA
jgi:hypothetical protein